MTNCDNGIQGHALLEMSKFGESRVCLRAAAAEAPCDADAMGPRRLLARLRAAEEQARKAAQQHGAALGRGLWSTSDTSQTSTQTQDKRLYADRERPGVRKSSSLRVASNPAFSKLSSPASVASTEKTMTPVTNISDVGELSKSPPDSNFGMVIGSLIALVASLLYYRTSDSA